MSFWIGTIKKKKQKKKKKKSLFIGQVNEKTKKMYGGIIL